MKYVNVFMEIEEKIFKSSKTPVRNDVPLLSATM